MSEIIIYEDPKGKAGVEVRFEGDTLWLSQDQMTRIFERDRSVITKHINNIFRDAELDEKSNVQIVHVANSDKPVKFCGLDVVLAVGYRVNSRRGIQFRQWATRVLREHLVQGFTLNQSRLAELGINEAQQALDLLSRTLHANALVNDTGKEALALIVGYAKTWRLLLYFVIKDHPFTDGNKRIGSFLFLLYMEQEGMTSRMNETALTALALLLAESAPANKDLLIRLIINLLTTD